MKMTDTDNELTQRLKNLGRRVFVAESGWCTINGHEFTTEQHTANYISDIVGWIASLDSEIGVIIKPGSTERFEMAGKQIYYIARVCIALVNLDRVNATTAEEV